MQGTPPCSAPACWWQMLVSGLCLCWELQSGTESVHFIYLFFPPIMLPSEISKHPRDLLVRGFPGAWKPLSRLPPWDRSPSLNPLSLFLSFIFCPTSFQRQWAAFLCAWCPLPVFRSSLVEFAQSSNDLLMNLWGRKWSPHPIPPPS